MLRKLLAASAFLVLAALPAKAQVLSFDPSTWHVYYNDFDRYAAADWTINTTEAGAGDATEALTSIDGGGLLITNDAADNDADFYQLPVESFKWEAGKRLFFKVRFKISHATQSDFAIGLQITDTTPLDVTDGIFFIKADEAATVDFRVEKNDTATTASAVATMVADTWITLAFYYEPSDNRFQYFVDGVRVGSSVVTNVPDDEELAVSFALQNGDGNARNMTIDYIVAAKER
jgi:hypothetical protein